MFRSLVTAIAFAALAVIPHDAVAASVVDLPEGDFYRPSGDKVSGFVGATTLYTRSPCPALNSMANHGYIARDGKNLTRDVLKTAIKKIFNVNDFLASNMIRQAPDGVFSLADLSKHNMIEHDVSFSRADSYYGADPALVTPAYINQLLTLAKPTLTLEKTAWLRAQRIAECKAKNPECDYGLKQTTTANFQLALMLRVLGGKNTEEIPFDRVDAFFNQERFPEGYTRPESEFNIFSILKTALAVTTKNTKKLSFDAPLLSTESSPSSSASLRRV